jgi:hypothetical protein
MTNKEEQGYIATIVCSKTNKAHIDPKIPQVSKTGGKFFTLHILTPFTFINGIRYRHQSPTTTVVINETGSTAQHFTDLLDILSEPNNYTTKDKSIELKPEVWGVCGHMASKTVPFKYKVFNSDGIPFMVTNNGGKPTQLERNFVSTFVFADQDEETELAKAERRAKNNMVEEIVEG